ncbi:NUDIX domain-containing protein, partial [Mycobacterium sp. 1245801.1]|uniref:NUDIX hydrolase n=1 Tax=Mycobacterium sp. 1245801.1 TaxID=1834075 RepID=UPI001E3D2A35
MASSESDYGQNPRSWFAPDEVFDLSRDVSLASTASAHHHQAELPQLRNDQRDEWAQQLSQRAFGDGPPSSTQSEREGTDRNRLRAWERFREAFNAHRDALTALDEGRDTSSTERALASARNELVRLGLDPDALIADYRARMDDGDGWVVSEDGTPYWGRYGAAGLLLRARGLDGSPVVLLQRRASWTDHGGTWGLPGGARARYETVAQAAIREAHEETGLNRHLVTTRLPVVTARASGIDWTYTTVIADAPYRLETTPNDESSELRWVREDEVADLSLHPGVAASWDALRTLMADKPLPAPRPSAQLDPTVDPTDVADAYSSPSGTTFFRTDNGPLYRYDTRPPGIIFEQGFASQAPHWLPEAGWVTPTTLVSTTRHPQIPLDFLDPAESRGHPFLYVIDAPGGVDVNATGGLARHAYQQEIAFPGGIRRENVLGAREVLSPGSLRENPDGTFERTVPLYGPFQANEHFNPDLPNPAPPAPLGRMEPPSGRATPSTSSSFWFANPNNLNVRAGDESDIDSAPPSSSGHVTRPTRSVMHGLPEAESGAGEGDLVDPTNDMSTLAEPESQTDRQSAELMPVRARGTPAQESPAGSAEHTVPPIHALHVLNDRVVAPPGSTGEHGARSTGEGLDAGERPAQLGIEDPGSLPPAYRDHLTAAPAESTTDAPPATLRDGVKPQEAPSAHQTDAANRPNTDPPQSDPTRLELPNPVPQLPARIGDHLVLGGLDVVEEFRSGSGDQGLRQIERVVRDLGGDEVWEANRAGITAMFGDDALKPKIPGMLRGGRQPRHVIKIGAKETLTIELQLDGADERSALKFKEQIDSYEFEHTSDSSNAVGSFEERRVTSYWALQGNVSHPKASDTANLIRPRVHDVALTEQRVDRQISGGQTNEPGTRFHGNIQAVISYKASGFSNTPSPSRLDYHVEVVVPTRDVDDHSANDPDGSGGPPRVQFTHALSGSDIVNNLWLRPDDPPPPAAAHPGRRGGNGRIERMRAALAMAYRKLTSRSTSGPVEDAPHPPPEHPITGENHQPRRPARGPEVQTVKGFVESEPMRDAFTKAYGKLADQAMLETQDWLTVELLQANLHGMTNKQPLILEFQGVPGARLEVHAFVEPLGASSNPRDTRNPVVGNAGGTGSGPQRIMRATGSTKKTEFHYGTETDFVRVHQDVVARSWQLPIPGRFRGQDGTHPSPEGGLDATHTRGQTRNETDSSQFRVRNTLKHPAPGQGWHGQARLRFRMHAPGSVPVSSAGRDERSTAALFTGAVHETRVFFDRARVLFTAPAPRPGLAPRRGKRSDPLGGAVVEKVAVHETRAEFDVLMEKYETDPHDDYRDQKVWAPPDRIWGDGPPPERRSVAESPWWRLGTGHRVVQGKGGEPEPAYQPATPVIPRGENRENAVPLKGLGSMDRVTNLDISGLRGMLDSMGRRAFGSDWNEHAPDVWSWYHLHRVRGALPAMTQHSPLTRILSSGRLSKTKVALTADIERLTFKRVINTLSSPSAELTRGSTSTLDRNTQTSVQGALGGRGGDFNDGMVLAEPIAGVSRFVRDAERVRNQERVAVGTKFDQDMAVFEGWVRLDGTMTGSVSTVHESGLFSVEIAIPLTELQGWRMHDDALPPTFTKDMPTGFIDKPAERDPAGQLGESPSSGGFPDRRSFETALASRRGTLGTIDSTTPLRPHREETFDADPEAAPSTRRRLHPREISYIVDPDNRDPDAVALAESPPSGGVPDRRSFETTLSSRRGTLGTIDSTTPLRPHREEAFDADQLAEDIHTGPTPEAAPPTRPQLHPREITYIVDPDNRDLDAVALGESPFSGGVPVRRSFETALSSRRGTLGTIDSTTPLRPHREETLDSDPVDYEPADGKSPGLTDIADGTVPAREPDPVPQRTMEWTPPSRQPHGETPRPPEHALRAGWHPSDMLIGVDPKSGLVEAIRNDLGPALGSRLDDAMAGVSDEFGPDVLIAKLTHESGRVWSHDIPVAGGKLTVKMRPTRDPHYDYIGPSKAFETDLSVESQSSTGQIRGDVLRRVLGGRIQIPLPHTSLSTQLTHTASIRPAASVSSDLIAKVDFQNSDVSNVSGETEDRVPMRMRTVDQHHLFRQPIRFDISYEQSVDGKPIEGIPQAPQPVWLSGVFSYAKGVPTPGERLSGKPQLAVDQIVDKVRPHRAAADTPARAAPEAGTGGAPGEDIVATHILDLLSDSGTAAFGDHWPMVRAELAAHVATMPIQNALGHYSRGGSATIDLKSVPGGTVVLRAHVDTLHRAESNDTTEFYSGGQQSMSSSVSRQETGNWEGYVQGQGDVLPSSGPVSLSLVARLLGAFGHETVDTQTENSASGVLFRQKVDPVTRVGTATIDAEMRPPEGSTSSVGTAQIDFVTRESPPEATAHLRYEPRVGVIRNDQPPHAGPGARSGPDASAPGGGERHEAQPNPTDAGLPTRGLSSHSIAKVVDGARFRADIRAHLAASTQARMRDLSGELDSYLSDNRLANKIPAMTRVVDDDGVELFRHGTLRITGRADVQNLEYRKIERKGGNTYVVNDVNQSRLRQLFKTRQGGGRALFGPQAHLPGFQAAARVGGGFTGRRRFGPTYNHGGRVAANAKFAGSYAVFDGTTRITLTVHDGDTRHPLPPVDIHGPIRIPETETQAVDAPPAEPGPSTTAAGHLREETPAHQPEEPSPSSAPNDEVPTAAPHHDSGPTTASDVSTPRDVSTAERPDSGGRADHGRGTGPGDDSSAHHSQVLES